jgi:hypothetical protein
MDKLTPRQAMNLAWLMLPVLVVCLAFNSIFLAAVATGAAAFFAGFAFGRDERDRRRDAESK